MHGSKTSRAVMRKMVHPCKYTHTLAHTPRLFQPIPQCRTHPKQLCLLSVTITSTYHFLRTFYLVCRFSCHMSTRALVFVFCTKSRLLFTNGYACICCVVVHIHMCSHTSMHPKSNGFFQLVTEQCVHNNKEIGYGTSFCRLQHPTRYISLVV